MKDRPILFSAPMVRALLDGSKTQTRRVIKAKEVFISASGAVMDMAEGHIKEINFPYGEQGGYLWVRETFALQSCVDGESPPFSDGRPIKHRNADDAEGYSPLWVQAHYRATDPEPELYYQDEHCSKCSDEDFGHVHWKPSIHMPRWASRSTLKMTGLKVERLHDISKKDAFAEGVTKRNGLYCMDWSLVGTPHPLGGVITESYIANDNPVGAFATYWERRNGRNSWDANPWIWAIEFEVIKQNIDQVLKKAA
jgi:hypothetical protein